VPTAISPDTISSHVEGSGTGVTVMLNGDAPGVSGWKVMGSNSVWVRPVKSISNGSPELA